MPCARQRARITLTAKVLPPPPLALTSIVPLSCAASKGLSSSTVRPGSAKANGIPEADPQRALIDARIGSGRQLARGLFDRLGELHRVGVRAAFADRLVDRQLVDRGA